MMSELRMVVSRWAMETVVMLWLFLTSPVSQGSKKLNFQITIEL